MSYPYGGGGYPPGPGYPQAGGYPPPAGGGMPQPGAYPPQGGMPQPAPAPAGLPYAAQPYPAQPGYPPQAGYPPAGGMPMPGQSPYPSGGAAPYPGGQAPYPGGPPQGGAPYPGGGGGAPYPGGPPPGGAAPYPGAAGAAPYPGAAGAAPYPGAGGTAPYPSGGAAPYPSGGAPAALSPSSYPSGGAGGASYPSGASAPPASAPARPAQQPHPKPTPSQPKGKSVDSNSTPYYEHAKKPGDSGTVKPLTSGFNAEADATQIKNCLKSSFINETILINIIPHRSNAQRQKIRLMYKTMYGKDLILDMRGKLGGDFESIAVGLMMTPEEYEAYLLNKAIAGAGTDEDVLIEILCTRTNTQMRQLSVHYREQYRRTIENDIKGDTSGHFCRLMVALANGARQEDQGVNQQKAEEDAKKLYKAGAGKIGTDESAFNSVFASQSFEQLRAVFATYERNHRKDMEKVIKSEMSGDLETGMKAIVRFTLDKHAYFANLLLKAMKGLGTNEKALIRTLVMRSEIDLDNIKRAFQNIKGEGKPLNHWLKKETSGPFRDILLHLIGDAH